MKMNNKKIIVALFAAVAFLAGHKAKAQQSVEPQADINIEKDGDIWKIVGVFTNNDEPKDSLHYKLKVERVGKSGKSSNSQGGHFDAKDSEEVTLSTVSINVAEGDTYNFDLTVYNKEDEIMCEKKLSSENK